MAWDFYQFFIISIKVNLYPQNFFQKSSKSSYFENCINLISILISLFNSKLKLLPLTSLLASNIPTLIKLNAIKY